MNISETVPGGRYIGVDGVAHDAFGKQIAEAAVSPEAPAEPVKQEPAEAAVSPETPKKRK